ncbi:hypothetical protein [Candidatus Spyradosoma sp. SGI.093]|uniref:hypothetical protein n=1 Tax=Candidatus Spyradosoma sp. SGI.093 TaxID=3420583 RepID=UPI003D09288B
MSFQIQKNIFSVVAVAAMFVVAFVSSFAVVAIQTERDALNAETRRMDKRIRQLEKEIPEARVKLDGFCNATTLRTQVVRSTFRDVRNDQLVRVRVAKIPYGRSSISDSRSEAIALASSPARLPLSEPDSAAR